MRRAIILCLSILPLAAGCHKESAGDTVKGAYDNRADAIDRQASAQPTATAKKIYRARADAIREEGEDREKGLKGGDPSSSKGPASATQPGGSQ